MRTFRQFGRCSSLVPSALIAAMCISSSAHATLITVDFGFTQATAYAGSAAGTHVSGSFSFDDAPYDLENTTYFHFTYGLPTVSLEMDWLGTHWTTSNARIGLLTFGLDRSLESWLIAGTYAPPPCSEERYHCTVYFPTSEPDFEIELQWNGGITGTGVVPNDAGEVTTITDATWSVRSPDVSVPEPETMALFGLGLAALAIAGRRRAKLR